MAVEERLDVVVGARNETAGGFASVLGDAKRLATGIGASTGGGMREELAGSFGRGSELAGWGKILKGSGAILGLSLVAKEARSLGDAFLAFTTEVVLQGKDFRVAMSEAIAKLPIVGGLLDFRKSTIEGVRLWLEGGAGEGVEARSKQVGILGGGWDKETRRLQLEQMLPRDRDLAKMRDANQAAVEAFGAILSAIPQGTQEFANVGDYLV